MELNIAIENFRNALISIWDNLVYAGLNPGDDEWHNVQNTLFYNLICAPTNLELGHYAFYSAINESQSKIVLVIDKGTELMLGTEKHSENKLSKIIQWSNSTHQSDDIYEFREFSSPENWADKSSLNYVIGQSITNQCLICIPCKNVKYKVA